MRNRTYLEQITEIDTSVQFHAFGDYIHTVVVPCNYNVQNA